MQLHGPLRGLSRTVIVVGSVVLFHVAALWALQAGLLRRVAEVVIPVQMLEVITPKLAETPQPSAKPIAPPPQRPVDRVTRPRARPAEPPRALAPQLQAIEQVAPTTDAPVGVATPAPPAPPPTVIAADAPRPAPAPEPAKVELPSSNASYLQNSMPVYPAISKRLGEQGKVLVRVLIGADGNPRQAELKRSSGFERLDRSALEYVMRCRYVPGKVAGMPQAMWYEAPVNFVLE